MKKSGLINIICSLLAVTVLVLGVVIALIFSDVIGIERGKLVISSASAISTYDGKELTDGDWHLVSGELKDGHRLSVSVSGSQTNVGISENYIVAKVVDSNGADVTEDYDIEYRPGALNVKQRPITILADSEVKMYDGEPLTSDKYTLGSPISLVAGHTLEVDIEGSITEVGEVENLINSVTIRDKHGDDVTRNYKITALAGTLAVYTQDTLVITSDSATREYTGQTLTDSDWRLVSGALESGHILQVRVLGEQTVAGTSENYMSIKVVDKYDHDMTGNYEIVQQPGKLTIIPAEITVKAADAQKVYDGTPLTSSGFTVTPSHFASNGFSFDVKNTGSQTQVGSSANMPISCKVKNPEGKDVTDSFVISYESGKLSVVTANEELRPSIKITTPSAEKTFDGKMLSSRKWTLDGVLLDGHTPVVNVTGSITDVGVTDNSVIVRICDNLGEDVTDSYDIEYDIGTLTVFPAEITIKTAYAEKTYDGTPLTSDEYVVTPNYYVEDFKFFIDVVGSQTEVGSSPNTIASCTVRGIGNADVTDNFKITKEEGILTVVAAEEELKTKLVYSSGSSEKFYDGRPLSNTECERTSGNLLDGHREVIQLLTAITEVGKADNVITVNIYDGTEDVTHMYDIEFDTGVLEVKPILLMVQANSAKKQYDGTPLTDDGYTVYPESSILEYNTLSASVAGSITLPGKAENFISSWTIVDRYGEDVSRHYSVQARSGELEVVKRDLTIISATDEKEYDGTPLTNHEYTLNPEDALLVGHSLEVNITGTITEVGTADNTVSSAKITDEFGSDSVHAYYNVMKEEGTLTVFGEGGSGSGGSGSGGSGGGGGLGGLGGGSSAGDKTVYFTVNSSSTDTVYLKMQSFGDYNGKDGWDEATEYGVSIDGTGSAYYITAYALDNSGMKPASLSVSSHFGILAVPYYTANGNFGVIQSDTNIYGSYHGSENYSVSYYNWDGVYGLRLPSAYRQYEEDYRDFVYDNYLTIDSETYEYMLGIIDEQGFDSYSSSIISQVASYIKRSARYNSEYDTALDGEDNTVVAFLDSYKEGVCRHYASAATLLFRALGIPARYTVGFASPVKANESTKIYGEQAHAWVEVYVDGIGWVNVEVTGNGSPATGTDGPITLNISPEYTGQIYTEGAVLYAKQSVSGFSSLAQDGYSYSVQIDGESRGLGYSISEIVDFKIYDPFGYLVYDKSTGEGSDRFIINYKRGQIQQYISYLTFGSSDFTKVYDGIAYENTVGDCYLVSGKLSSGYYYVIEPTASLTDVNQISSTYDVIIYKDGVICSDHYRIAKTYGKITVESRAITVEAGSDEKVYDGTALTMNVLYYDFSALADGDYIDTYTIQGSQTNIGQCSNVIKKIVIRNSSGKDVTANYTVTTVDGKLTVTAP